VGGRAVVGNPELTRALIRNYDVRWELFPGAEQLVAASFFYKDFSDPVERFVEPTAQLRTSFTNAQSARNLGLELEARKLMGRRVLAAANYTFVDSEIRLDQFQTNVLTTLQRPLAGTSQHMFNGLFEVRAGDTSARVLLNYFDDRIADVGSLGLPDIVEQGRSTLDFALSQRIGRLDVRFSADNLTNEPVTFTQGDEPQRRFTIGRTLMLQFGYSAF
jgi:outer membrane receptor protein involved in Fe transport